jgi:rhodanese-related sulfurtransferase
MSGGRAIHAPCDDGSVGPAVQSSHVPEISREELVAQLQRGRVTLLDVLSPESFAANHIPRAVNLPVADIPSRAADVVEDRAAPIVVYCGGPT